jgi:hypothetical protein
MYAIALFLSAAGTQLDEKLKKVQNLLRPYAPANPTAKQDRSKPRPPKLCRRAAGLYTCCFKLQTGTNFCAFVDYLGGDEGSSDFNHRSTFFASADGAIRDLVPMMKEDARRLRRRADKLKRCIPNEESATGSAADGAADAPKSMGEPEATTESTTVNIKDLEEAIRIARRCAAIIRRLRTILKIQREAIKEMMELGNFIIGVDKPAEKKEG